MKDQQSSSEERGQAFTLEGFISAIVILTAVLFALQAVVITPTTGGAVDRAAQAQEEREVQDVLRIAAENGELSELVRNWNTGASDPGWDGGESHPDAAYTNSEFANLSDFGHTLDEQLVNASGKAYNVEFIAYDDSGTRYTESIVQMGGGKGGSAVSASYFVTVYDEQPLTEPDGSGGFDEQSETLEEARADYSGDQEYPFPNRDEDSTDFTVIEVRVTVW